MKNWGEGTGINFLELFGGTTPSPISVRGVLPTVEGFKGAKFLAGKNCGGEV